MSVGVMKKDTEEKKTNTRIGTLFKRVRLRKGLKQGDIAGKIGHSAARISQIETGQIPGEDIALRIARELDLDLKEVLYLRRLDWLDYRDRLLAVRVANFLPEGQSALPAIFAGGRDDPLEPIEIKWVPVIGKIPAGEPQTVPAAELRDADGSVPIEAHRASASVYALRVAGTSMVKWGIHPGDIVTVDPEAQWSEGDEVVVSINDEWTLKKIRKLPGAILLEGTTDDASIVLTKDSGEVTIEGVVIKVTKNR